MKNRPSFLGLVVLSIAAVIFVLYYLNSFDRHSAEILNQEVTANSASHSSAAERWRKSLEVRKALVREEPEPLAPPAASDPEVKAAEKCFSEWQKFRGLKIDEVKYSSGKAQYPQARLCT